MKSYILNIEKNLINFDLIKYWFILDFFKYLNYKKSKLALTYISTTRNRRLKIKNDYYVKRKFIEFIECFKVKHI